MDLSPLIAWFEAHPDQIKDGVNLNAWTHITDGKKFVASHLDALRTYGGRPAFRRYYERLLLYWAICKGEVEGTRIRHETRFNNKAEINTTFGEKMDMDIIKEIQDQVAKDYGYLNYEDFVDTKGLSDRDQQLLTEILLEAVKVATM